MRLDDLPDLLDEAGGLVWHETSGIELAPLLEFRRALSRPVPLIYEVQPRHLLSCSELTSLAALTAVDTLVCPDHCVYRFVDGMLPNVRPGGAGTARSPQVRYIPWGVSPSEPTSEEKQDARHLLGLPLDGVLALCTDGLSPGRGADPVPLLQCLGPRLREWKGIRVVLAGADRDGITEGLRGLLTDLRLQGTFVLCPNPSRTAQYLLMTACDLFLSLSDWPCDDTQVEVAEAMGRAMPVIAAGGDEGGGTISPGVAGPLAPRTYVRGSLEAFSYWPLLTRLERSCLLSQATAIDLDEAATALERLLRDPTLRHAIGRAGQQFIMERCDWRSVVAEYDDLWARAASCAAWPDPGSRSPHVMDRAGPPETLVSLFATPVEGSQMVSITQLGDSVATLRNPVVHHSVHGVVTPSLLIVVLQCCRRPCTIDALANSVLGRVGVRADESLSSTVLYHIGWCLKQGLLRLAPRCPRADRPEPGQ